MEKTLQVAFEAFLEQYDCQWDDAVWELVEDAFLAGWLAAGGEMPD